MYCLVSLRRFDQRISRTSNESVNHLVIMKTRFLLVLSDSPILKADKGKVEIRGEISYDFFVLLEAESRYTTLSVDSDWSWSKNMLHL